MGEALVPHAKRLRIERSNFRLLSDISSKESTLQLVYDVLRLTPFFKAFLVTADVLEIYMQEFWATATVHHHSIRFKMDNKKHIVNLESFREMLHIYPILPSQSFVEPPFEEEILSFLHFLGHSGAIRRLTDVNINKLHQPWRSFAAIINKCDDDEGKDSDGDDEGNDGDDGEEGDDDDDDDEQDDDKEEGSDDEQASDEEEFIHPSLSTHAEEETRNEESFDPILKTPENTDDEGNGEENLGTNVGRDEGQDEEDEADELYKDININLGRGIQLGDVHTTQEVENSHVTLTPVNPDGMESIFETTSQMDVQTPTSMAPFPMSAPTLTPSTIATITTTKQAPLPPTIAPSTLLKDLPNFGSLFGFDNRPKTLEANFSEFMQTNQFAGAVSSIPGIVQRYMDPRMNKAVKVTLQIQSGRNKSIQRSNEQKNLYKALVEAYESDKIILDTYGETFTLKRHRDDADKDEDPSVGSDRGSKRCREGKEPESASALKEKATRSAGKSTQGSKSRQTSESESAKIEEPMQTTFEMEEPSHL
nr:hypothetical protein [Tanacetum cinerariifolium]